MADRQVKATRKNGEITALCNDSQAWSPRLKGDAIRDIESGLHTYFVLWPGNARTEVRVIAGAGGKYLRTDRDGTVRNNLLDLPDC